MLKTLTLLREKIKFDGWIVIPPTDQSGELHLRVEWYTSGFKDYVFEMNVAKYALFGNKNVVEEFIYRANRVITRHRLTEQEIK